MKHWLDCVNRAMQLRPTQRFYALYLLAASLFALACQDGEDDIAWVNPPPIEENAKPVAQSPDRLPPGELLEGADSVFGFTIPKDTRLIRTTRKTARVEGNVSYDQLTSYVKDRISVRHAEMFGTRLIFPNARIRGNKNGIYDFILLRQSPGAVLLIKDQTPLPPTFGLTEAERWKKAGMKPSGGVIDPNALE